MTWEEACQILGVAVTASIAEIEACWIDKNNLLHPDKTSGLPERARRRAEEELKHINAAHDFLKNPKNKPRSSPPKLRVSPQHIRFKDIELGQRKTTTIKIESVGGSYSKFWMDDAPTTWLKVIEVKSTTNDPMPLEATLEATTNGNLQKQTSCTLLIRLEDEKTKAKDEVVVKVELQIKATSRQSIFNRIARGFGGTKITPPYQPPTKPSPLPRGGYRGRLPRKIYLGDLVTDHTWHPVDFGNLRRWAQKAETRLNSGEVLQGSHFMYRRNHYSGTYEVRLRYRFASCRYNR